MKLKVFRLNKKVVPSSLKSTATHEDDEAPNSSDLGSSGKTLRSKEPKRSSSKKEKELPDCWYFSSCHILINRERVLNDVPQLRRIRMLDDLARFHAEDMAERLSIFHSVASADNLKHKLKSKFAGENIQRGSSIRSMHTSMMEKGKRSRDNILSPQFTEFGMGTALASDGKLYMVQLFRGPPPN